MAKASQAIQYIMGFDSWQVVLLAVGCLNTNPILQNLEYLEFYYSKHLFGIHTIEISKRICWMQSFVLLHLHKTVFFPKGETVEIK